MKTIGIILTLFLLFTSSVVVAGSIEDLDYKDRTWWGRDTHRQVDDYDVTIDADYLNGETSNEIKDEVKTYTDNQDNLVIDYVDSEINTLDVDLQTQIDVLDTRLNTIENVLIPDLRSDLTILDTRVTDNEQDILDLQGEISRIDGELLNIRTDIDGLKTVDIGLQTQIGGLLLRVIANEDEIIDLWNQVNQNTDNIALNLQEIDNTKTYINNNEQDWTKDSIGMKFAKFWKVLLNWERPVDDRTALRKGREVLDEFGSVENYLYNQFKLKLMQEIYSGVYEKEFTEFIAEKEAEKTTTTTTLKPKVIPPTVEEMNCESDEKVRAIYQNNEIIGYQCWKAKSGNTIPTIKGPILLS